ncbi:MAG: aspartate/methionine/tyrosine aminotransferase [Planctomycetota bacterium]|jgi:aspartate/methionine/tyrosine aminotransferase
MASRASSTEPGPNLGAFRPIPFMGVIYVVAEAVKLGFWNGNPDWCNLGQGQPEVGELEGAPKRMGAFEFDPAEHAYGPVEGTLALRQAIADYYNRTFRSGKAQQYGPENVSVAAGGRLILSRIFAALGEGVLGYQVPDYTAYEDMIGYHQHRFTPVSILAHESDGFGVPVARLREEVRAKGFSAYLVSNPCNPTGRVIRGEDLAQTVALASEENCTLILDEFYSQFIYDGDQPGSGAVSAAEFIEDIESEPVVLVDGLTKGFRYPGLRLGWAVGPKAMVETITRAASAIDGGPPQVLQRVGVEILQADRVIQETDAVRRAFSIKRNLVLERLEQMGIRCHPAAEGTFYQWASIADLPAPLNDAETFFRRALERKVMTVPGAYFDVNPGRRRRRPSPLSSWLRFSFGPSLENVRMGLDRLAEMVAEARA